MRFNFTRGRIRSATFLSTMHRCTCVSIVQLCERSASCTPPGFRMEFKSGWYAISTTRNNLSSSPIFFQPSLFLFSPFFFFIPMARLFNLGYEIGSQVVVRRAVLIERTRATTTETEKIFRSFLFHESLNRSKYIQRTNQITNTLNTRVISKLLFQMQSTFQIHFFRSELTRFLSAFEKKEKKEKSGKRKTEINRAIEAKRVN